MVSIACSDPMRPGSTPSTPASAQLGASSAGGGSGTMSRYVGPSLGSNTVTMPSKRKIDPWTTGMPSFTEASLTMKRVGKLPVPSGDVMSTQEGFGKILNEIARDTSPLAERIVTTPPDVIVSPNPGP